MTVKKALTIAGSDSGGGAGIQADLKTFSALGVYGASVLTAVTAQNTMGVTRVLELPTELIAAQIDAVMTDIGADAVKIGMLSSSEIIRTVAEQLREHRAEKVVLDPVMVAKSGDRLLREEAVDALRSILLPQALVVTPNLPEAEVLADMKIESVDDMRRAARKIVDMGARSVVVKGGHREGPATDVFYDGAEFYEFTKPRVATQNTHGTGCTFSSAIAAHLALGRDLRSAVGAAKNYLTAALQAAFPVGHGHGPVHHFYRWWGA